MKFFSPSHIEGSSTSVGRPGNCQSPVLAVENVDLSVLSSWYLSWGYPCISISVFLSVSHLLPPCPTLFWLYGFHLYVWHVHTSVVASASGVLLSAELICMKYRILFLIIIIISLDQLLLSYIANTSRTHAPARTRAHTHSTHPPHTSPYRYSMGLCQPTVMARSAGDNSWSLAIEINTGDPVSPRFWVFFAF